MSEREGSENEMNAVKFQELSFIKKEAFEQQDKNIKFFNSLHI